MKTVATNKKLRELITGIDSETLIARPDFQRRLVWTNKEKLNFIKTVLQEYPFPEIYIAAGTVDENTGTATEYLVDGQQRITTLYQYFKAAEILELPSEFPSYASLTSDQKQAFLQYDVVVRDLGSLNIESIKEIFQKINSTSYSLNAMEIDNSRYAGEFKIFGEKFSESDFFNDRKFFTVSDIRRMQDLRYCLIIVATMMSSYFDQSSKIESFLQTYNDAFPKAEEINERISKVTGFIDACKFDEKSRVWNKADLFTLFIELDKFYVSNKKLPSLRKIAKSLKEFYSSMQGNVDTTKLPPNKQKYLKAAIQGSNSRSRRIERAEVIREQIEIS